MERSTKIKNYYKGKGSRVLERVKEISEPTGVFKKCDFKPHLPGDNELINALLVIHTMPLIYIFFNVKCPWRGNIIPIGLPGIHKIELHVNDLLA